MPGTGPFTSPPEEDSSYASFETNVALMLQQPDKHGGERASAADQPAVVGEDGGGHFRTGQDVVTLFVATEEDEEVETVGGKAVLTNEDIRARVDAEGVQEDRSDRVRV